MKRTHLLPVLLCTLLLQHLSGQKVSVPVFEISHDTFLEHSLDKRYFKVLEDAAGTYTIGDVQQLSAEGKFHDVDPQGANVHTYWFQYKLKNTCTHAVKLALRAGADKGDFYIIDSAGTLNHFMSGKKLKWSQKNGIKQYNLVPIALRAKEEVLVYYRRESAFKGLSETASLSVYNTDKFIESKILGDESIALDIPGLYAIVFFSMFLLTGFIILMLYWNTKERAFLYFSLFLFSLCFSNNPANPAIDLFLREHPEWNWMLFLISLWPAFFIHFLRHYFQTVQASPLLDKVLFMLATLNIGSTISRVCLFDLDYDTIDIILFLLTIVPLILAILLFYQKHRTAGHYFILAILPTIVVVALSYINYIIELNLKWFYGWEDLLYNIAIGWMVVVVFSILFKKYATQQLEIMEGKLMNEKLSKEKEIERNQLMEHQKLELERQVKERTAELSQSLTNLQSAQAQLIQSEKLASLGELTAGIAHEIQNPLNFVNNFSELSVGLAKELKEEIEKIEIPENDKDYIGEILTDLSLNQEKINHHGKRAANIVTGMLQHARTGTGAKEPIDLNALADEYLRLSYHGLRAKDSSFNAKMVTDFDPSIGKAAVIPQDMGRVLLNLINNAFYAVHQRNNERNNVGEVLNLADVNAADVKKYEPTITVSTRMTATSTIEIRIRDNGTGIPEAVKAKIFQPFFTTKPTGQGTGLGLSLAYDIVTKGHGGTLDVESESGKGTEFTITIPKQ